MVALINVARLRRRVLVERPVTQQDPDYGSQQTTGWVPVGTWWAEVLDVIGKEATQDSMRALTRPSRVRMRWTDKVDPTMRLTVDGRVMQIVGIAEIGRRDGLELLVEQYSTSGGGAQ